MIELTDEQASVFRLCEADRIALANRTNIPQILRKIASRHIAQQYPTTRHPVVDE
jgi:hypothetical protein